MAGRPSKSTDRKNHVSRHYMLRLTEEEAAALDAIAQHTRQTKSSWLRQQITQAAAALDEAAHQA